MVLGGKVNVEMSQMVLGRKMMIKYLDGVGDVSAVEGAFKGAA